MPPVDFHESCNRYKEHNNTIWQNKFSATKHFFNTVTIISYAFLLAMNKNLCAMLLTICMTVRNVACLSCCYRHCCNAPFSASVCSHPPFGVHKCSANVCEWQFFFSCMEEFPCAPLPHRHLCVRHLCHTAPLLPSVAGQQCVVRYWREGSTPTAVPPTSSSDIVGQQIK